MNDLILIAEIKSIYSEDGFLLLKSFSDFEERFYNLNEVFIDVFGDYRKFIVDEVFIENKKIFIKFMNFDNSDELGFLLNKKIFIKEEEQVELSEDEFYIHELIGLKVYYRGKTLGEITDVYNLPANDVIVVQNNKDEILIPVIKDCIKNVDVDENVLIINDEFDLGLDA